MQSTLLQYGFQYHSRPSQHLHEDHYDAVRHLQARYSHGQKLALLLHLGQEHAQEPWVQGEACSLVVEVGEGGAGVDRDHGGMRVPRHSHRGVGTKVCSLPGRDKDADFVPLEQDAGEPVMEEVAAVAAFVHLWAVPCEQVKGVGAVEK